MSFKEQMIHCTISSISLAIAKSITCPFDVMTIRFQCQGELIKSGIITKFFRYDEANDKGRGFNVFF